MGQLVYTWWAIALALLALETIIPGASILWFGIAAFVVGAVVWLFPELPLLGQVVIFGICSIASVAVYWKWFRSHEVPSDQPLLNRKADRLVGREFVLDAPIQFGRGKLKIGDALWTVEGPDLASGTRVRVCRTDGLNLTVEKMDS
ncbi:MAG: NfeD family protein [Xanthomonadales bacterium]|nr:NfeD family protein [Xanthomonadales bacterium]MBK7145448.1 NfeD family protein [Xanthomonadales bacterium]MCC6563242.1 NfeD family protein [Xanthomonadales bacterium]